MNTLRTRGNPQPNDLSAERVRNERVLESDKFKRDVGAYARANGISLPMAMRDLVIAGLKAKQMEVNSERQSTAV